MLADLGTKSLPGPSLARFTDWAIGVRFYPTRSSQQYIDMEFNMFSMTYLQIVASRSSSSKS